MKKLMKTYCVTSVAAAVILLSACESKTPTPPVEPVVLTADQQSIYETNCKVCHGTPGSGAPQTGDPAQWQDRAELGMDSMLANAINGYQGMPAMGGCFDCSDEDLRALTSFMVTLQKESNN